MKLAVGSDERTNLTETVIEELRARGHDLTLFGPLAGEPLAWPQVARQVGETILSGEAEQAILFCWTGTGISMAANKIPGVRAALCADAQTARGARLWNDANVLCMSLRLTSEVVAKEILQTWFDTDYQPNPEDDACLAQLNQIETIYRQKQKQPQSN